MEKFFREGSSQRSVSGKVGVAKGKGRDLGQSGRFRGAGGVQEGCSSRCMPTGPEKGEDLFR